MCRHGGKSTKDFCKMSDEQIIKNQFYGVINKTLNEQCAKKYGVEDGWDALRKNGRRPTAKSCLGDNWKKLYTEESIARCEEINKWKYAHEQVESIIKSLPCLVDHSVKKTADFYRMCSKVGSALAKIRNAPPSRENYNLVAGIVGLLASQSKYAIWDGVEKPRLKK